MYVSPPHAKYCIRNAMKRGGSRLDDPSSLEAEAPPPPKRKAGDGAGHWAMKLLASMENPELVVSSDDLVVTIKDAYPKAKHHYLVLPRADIPHLRALGSSHVALLEHMLDCGKELAERQIRDKSSLQFRYGYHALPSMSRLHMHVISQDFLSPSLKTKKHWNSFNSDFFLDADIVIGMLKAKGMVDLKRDTYESMLKLPLKCHLCGFKPPNMPRLKEHLERH